MSEPQLISPPSATAPRFTPLFLPILLLLFVGSGAAALIYETVWFQLLEFFIGSSAYSIGVLLGTFMGGMCLGSFLFSYVIKRRSDGGKPPLFAHPLAIYAMLELAIGVCGILVTRLMPFLDQLYAEH